MIYVITSGNSYHETNVEFVVDGPEVTDPRDLAKAWHESDAEKVLKAEYKALDREWVEFVRTYPAPWDMWDKAKRQRLKWFGKTAMARFRGYLQDRGFVVVAHRKVDSGT